MAIEGKIAEYAKGELPQTWSALAGTPTFGEPSIELKILSVCTKLFGEPVSVAVQDALDQRVLDYAGKLVALELITPGIDYWSKQPLSIGATGRNENKGYLDRARDLRELRAYLLEQTRIMWPEVEALLPRRRVNRVANVPRVRDVAVAHTPNPYDFDKPFAPKSGGTA